jgi:hypothetical protein
MKSTVVQSTRTSQNIVTEFKSTVESTGVHSSKLYWSTPGTGVLCTIYYGYWFYVLLLPTTEQVQDYKLYSSTIVPGTTYQLQLYWL